MATFTLESGNHPLLQNLILLIWDLVNILNLLYKNMEHISLKKLLSLFMSLES